MVKDMKCTPMGIFIKDFLFREKLMARGCTIGSIRRFMMVSGIRD
jgi:hypothetical protein